MTENTCKEYDNHIYKYVFIYFFGSYNIIALIDLCAITYIHMLNHEQNI